MVNLRSFSLISKRLFVSFLITVLAMTNLLATYPFSGPEPMSPILGRPAEAPIFGKLPLSFISNAGQTDPAVRFQAHGMGSTIFFTPSEVVLTLPSAASDYGPQTATEGRNSGIRGGRSSVIRVRFEGPNPAPEIIGKGRLPGVVNYFIGNDPARWHTNLPVFGEIVYRDLYPGVDLLYTGVSEMDGTSLSLKGTYSIAPGADPTRIRWRHEGARGVMVDEATGDLRIQHETGSSTAFTSTEIVEGAPTAWQMVDGQRVPVSVGYAITPDGDVGFSLGKYDQAYPLIIDPTLSYSTYLGGSWFDYGWDIAVDSEGNAYVVGQTSSSDFPTQNPFQSEIGGGPLGDAFVVKLNATGSALVYATYLGGVHNDSGYGIAVDSDGSAYVTGDTLSFDFPTKNAVQPISGGGGPYEGDAFVVKLDPTGSALVYATYLGGGGDELSYGIALDTFGNAYVAGYTSSTNFPTVNAPQPEPAFPEGLNVNGDAFATQVISASGVYTWGYSTYLGGVDLDIARDIAVDVSGNAYITGHTRSTDFPTLKPVQPDYGGGWSSGRGDVFVTQVISASGVYTWGYSTYLGGASDDSGYAIAVDSSGDAYVTGETSSTNFPKVNPLQASYAGNQDAFVTKVIGAGSVYAWGYSTYLGGDGNDYGLDVAVDSGGSAYLTGHTSSTDFPTSDDAHDKSCGTDGLCDSAGGDVFFTKLNVTGDALAYSTYLGGRSTEFGYGIAVDASDNAYLTGFTRSSDFPTTTGAYDTACGTDGQCNGYPTDAFVAKFTMDPDLVMAKAADPPGGTPVTRNDTITYRIAATNKGAPVTNLVIADVIPSGTAYVPDSVATNLGSASFDGTKIIVSVPSLTTGAAVTASFQVSVTTGLTTTITNKAVLTGDQVEAQVSNLVSHSVQGTEETQSTFLPIVLKGEGAIPPPGCAPYVVATISVGDEPRGIALDPARNRVYVANHGSDSLSVIDSSNGVIHTLDGIVSANGVAFDPVHDIIWVTSYALDQVIPIDAASLIPLSPIAVGTGPWGVAYDRVHDYVYVVNNLGNSVTVIDAAMRVLSDTLSGDFDQPFHIAANPVTGRAYVTNFGDSSVAVIDGHSVSKVDLGGGDPGTEPYGVAVDDMRDLVYVAEVDGHRVVVIGTDATGTPDQVLGWAALHRGFGDPARPVPLRAIAINPDIGPAGDGGHLWATTSVADGSEANQVLFIPKGWPGFHWPAPYEITASPSEGIAVDRASDRVYVSAGSTPGIVTVLGDSTDACMVPFGATNDGFEFETVTVQ
jgi:uncharacterized repeat protein (TIGR01451 family)